MALKAFVEKILYHASTAPITGGVAHVDIWNNQVQYMRDQTIEAIALPAIFVEVLFTEGAHDGEQMTTRQCQLRLHIVMEKLNTEGTFARNLVIYDMRDVVLQWFSKWHETNYGYPYDFTPFQYTGESPQYDHDNLYEYVLEFSTMFSEVMGNYQQSQETQGTITEIILNPDKI